MALEKLLAIFDRDVLYASRLMEYFKKLGWEGFEILLFTKQESLESFLEYQSVEILLYGGDNIPEDLVIDNIKHIFYLCEDLSIKRDKPQMICKYQAAENIASDILTSYTRLEDKNQGVGNGEVQFVSIFSPVSGVEKLSYAWALAKDLSNKKRVLFVYFDLLPTAFMIRSEDMGQPMSELLYYLKESKMDNSSKMKSYINYSEKLSYLSGLTHGFDLLSLSKKDIESLMETIKNHMDYELVVFYLGMYTEASMEILSYSNEVYITTCDLQYEELVVKEWERQMELIGVVISEAGYHSIKLPTAEKLAGPDPLPEKVLLGLRPMVEKLSEQI